MSQRIDPLSLYDRLSDGGTRPGTALFESPDSRTLLMSKAAVRAECRGESVTFMALSANGRSLVDAVRARLASEEPAGDTLELRYPFSTSLDAEERLAAPTPLHAIRALLGEAADVNADPFAGMALGVIAFDYAALGENLPAYAEDPHGFPDYVFWVPDALLVFEEDAPPRILCAAFADTDADRTTRNHHDAVERLGALLRACEGELPPLGTQPGSMVQSTSCDLDDQAYCEVVQRLKDEIAAGEVYQIVPSRTFSAPCPDPLAAYAALRRLEPNAYRFYVSADDFTLFGASPETSVRVFDQGATTIVEVKPIAGTRPRGTTADEDGRLEAEMRLDGKELAEHMMLVDLARNDVARISRSGTRQVAQLMTVERHARVMHLVSRVAGQLAPDRDAVDALSACLNMGTLTGAPKIRATELLRQTERTRRGPYGGAVGWIAANGHCDTAVVIRTALVQDGTAFVRTGAGVVHDSDPQSEADETVRKASALLSILGHTRVPA